MDTDMPLGDFRRLIDSLSFPAKLTGESSGHYSWQEMIFKDDATLAVLTNGRSGTTTTNYARELQGVTGIVSGTIVRMWLAPGSTDYVFEYLAVPQPLVVNTPSPGSAPVPCDTLFFNDFDGTLNLIRCDTGALVQYCPCSGSGTGLTYCAYFPSGGSCTASTASLTQATSTTWTGTVTLGGTAYPLTLDQVAPAQSTWTLTANGNTYTADATSTLTSALFKSVAFTCGTLDVTVKEGACVSGCCPDSPDPSNVYICLNGTSPIVGSSFSPGPVWGWPITGTINGGPYPYGGIDHRGAWTLPQTPQGTPQANVPTGPCLWGYLVESITDQGSDTAIDYFSATYTGSAWVLTWFSSRKPSGAAYTTQWSASAATCAGSHTLNLVASANASPDAPSTVTLSTSPFSCSGGGGSGGGTGGGGGSNFDCTNAIICDQLTEYSTGTGIGGQTPPTTTGGNTWQNGGSATSVGSTGINFGMTSDPLCINSTFSGGILVQVDFTPPATGNWVAQLFLGATKPAGLSGGWSLQWDSVTSTVYLYNAFDGSSSSGIILRQLPYGGTPGVAVTLTITLDQYGNIACYVSGTSLFTYNLIGTGNPGTYVGFQDGITTPSAGTWRNFKVLPLLGGFSCGGAYLCDQPAPDVAGTALASHAENVGPGWTEAHTGTATYSWTTIGASIFASVTVASAGLSFQYSDAGQSNGTLNLNLMIPSGYTAIGLLFRYSSSTNYWYLVLDSVAGGLKLGKVVGGVAATVGTSVFTVNTVTPYALQVVLKGSGTTVSATVNGAHNLTSTSTDLVGNTKHGMIMDTSGAFGYFLSLFRFGP